jgi:hypothetical protein
VPLETKTASDTTNIHEESNNGDRTSDESLISVESSSDSDRDDDSSSSDNS